MILGQPINNTIGLVFLKVAAFKSLSVPGFSGFFPLIPPHMVKMESLSEDLFIHGLHVDEPKR